MEDFQDFEEFWTNILDNNKKQKITTAQINYTRKKYVKKCTFC